MCSLCNFFEDDLLRSEAFCSALVTEIIAADGSSVSIVVSEKEQRKKFQEHTVNDNICHRGCLVGPHDPQQVQVECSGRVESIHME